MLLTIDFQCTVSLMLLNTSNVCYIYTYMSQLWPRIKGPNMKHGSMVPFFLEKVEGLDLQWCPNKSLVSRHRRRWVTESWNMGNNPIYQIAFDDELLVFAFNMVGPSMLSTKEGKTWLYTRGERYICGQSIRSLINWPQST